MVREATNIGLGRGPFDEIAKMAGLQTSSSTFSMTVLLAAAVLALAIYSSGYLRGTAAQESNLQTELGPLLTSSASIFLQGTPSFGHATARWSEYDGPTTVAAVAVATEQDVRQTGCSKTLLHHSGGLIIFAQILYANAHNLSFLAYSGGHGCITSLGRVRNGIQISMSRLNQVKVAADGKTATIGGGANVKDVTKALAAAGKRTGLRGEWFL
jgi:hypothetical protein